MTGIWTSISTAAKRSVRSSSSASRPLAATVALTPAEDRNAPATCWLNSLSSTRSTRAPRKDSLPPGVASAAAAGLGGCAAALPHAVMTVSNSAERLTGLLM